MTPSDYKAIREALELHLDECEDTYLEAKHLYSAFDQSRIERERAIFDDAKAALAALEKYRPKDEK